MKILLTNDDGIDSDGLRVLSEHIKSTGKYKLTVIAPDKDRSGISNATFIFKGQVKVSNLSENVWVTTGTPADCVVVALESSISEKPDIVLSGINQGANLGTDVIYSGTAAAARQASLFGLPAVAISLDGSGPYHWDMASSWVLEHLEELVSYSGKYAFVNVNIPNRPEGPQGMMLTWPAIKRYKSIFLTKDTSDGGLVCTLEDGGESVLYEEGSDHDAVSRNFVSVSALYNFSVACRELCPQAPQHAAVLMQELEKCLIT